MRKLFLLTAFIAATTALLALASLPAAADCEDGDDNANNIVCDVDSGDWNGNDGNDTMTVNEDVEIEGQVDGGDGDDAIVNNGNIASEGDGIEDDEGSNTITNNGMIVSEDDDGIDVDTGSSDSNIITNSESGTILADDIGIDGGSGSDTIINDGEIFTGDGGIDGQSGSDLIITTGVIETNGIGIEGGSGDDTIFVSGYVEGGEFCSSASTSASRAPLCEAIAVYGDTGDDMVIVSTDSTILGIIDGGDDSECDPFCRIEDSDFDILFFSVTGDNQAEAEAAAAELAALLAAEDPKGGTLNYNGNFYEWRNFEELSILLLFLIEQARANDDETVDTDLMCDFALMKAFRQGDAFSVVSGFTVNPSGYTIAVFGKGDAANGARFALGNDAGYYVQVFVLEGGVMQINVYDASGTLIDDQCRFGL